jgi:hypothetical protein
MQQAAEVHDEAEYLFGLSQEPPVIPSSTMVGAVKLFESGTDWHIQQPRSLAHSPGLAIPIAHDRDGVPVAREVQGFQLDVMIELADR